MCRRSSSRSSCCCSWSRRCGCWSRWGRRSREQALRPVEFTRFADATVVDFTLDTRLQLPEQVAVGVDGRPPVRAPAGPAHGGGGRALGVPGRRGGAADRGRVGAGQRGVAAAAARRRFLRSRAAGHLVRARGDGAGHDGPAARAHPLPHQPGRPQRAPHRRDHRRPARHVLPVPGRVRAAGRRAAARALPLRRDRHRRRRPALAGRSRAGPATCSPRCSRRAPSPLSWRRRWACCWPSPARSRTTSSPRHCAGCA